MYSQPAESPVIATPVSPQREPKKTSKVLHVLLPLLLACLGLVIGLAIGCFRYSSNQKGFESQMTIRILPSYKNPDFPHRVLIKGLLMIEACINRDGGKLRNLKSFDDMPSDEVSEFIRQRLIVESLTEDNLVLRLRLVTFNANDSPTLLNNLGQTYEDYLLKNMRRDCEREIALTRKVLDDVKSEYQQKQRAIENLRNKKTDDAKNEALQDQLAELAVSKESLNTLKSTVSKLEYDANNSVAVMERIENAQQGKYKVRGSTDVIFYMALGGLVAGLVFGTTFSFILK